jgi:plastocyanin
MRRALLVAALTAAAALAGATPSWADSIEVDIPGKYFDPGRVTAVAGDVVTWHNSDYANHDIRGVGGAFTSGLLLPHTAFSQRFGEPGTYPFVCTLHPFMSGQVAVASALLQAPAGAVLSGERLQLAGRAPAGTPSVTIERQGADGAFAAVATAAADADGAFRATVEPVDTGDYRAVTAAGPGPAVTVRVLARLDVGLTLRRSKRFDRLGVKVAPKPPRGVQARLEYYVRERFDWRGVRLAPLDASGRAVFRLPAGLRRRARVVLVRAPAGPRIGVSRALRLWLRS